MAGVLSVEELELYEALNEKLANSGFDEVAILGLDSFRWAKSHRSLEEMG